MQPCCSSLTQARLGLTSYSFLRHILVLLTLTVPCQARLSYDFYDASCPNLVRIVRTTVLARLLRDPTTPAALIRLFFHDCQVQGCDASILLDSQGSIVSELGAAANLGIRRLEVIDAIKGAVENICPETVSCADLVVLAARESVRITGGPNIAVPLGRRDGVTASKARAEAELPSAETGFNGFLQVFQSKGMSLEESVAILGSHTVGVGHCASFANRLYPKKDQRLGPILYSVLTLRCPARVASRSDGGPVFPNDLTPLTFDTQYFRNAVAGRGLFRVDSEVASHTKTAAIMRSFAANRANFYRAYSSAFVKLSLNDVLTQGGTIRRTCRLVN